MILAEIPSPPVSAFGIGPLTIHVYALCILTGIAVAMWWAGRRWAARGGDGDDMFDIGFVAVIAGIIGARLYHVLVTDFEGYFGPGADPLSVLYIWQGGLGIGGAVAGGALGAWVMARRKRVSFAVLADTVAPTLMVAQAIGRLGNWFNQELYGGPTALPWGLRITCVTNGAAIPGCAPGIYHPTFAYEALWNLVGCLLLVTIARRLRLGGGRVFWGYVSLYATGRVLTELLRTDPAQLVLGVRIHVWFYLAVLLLGLVMLAVLTLRRRRRGGEAHRVDGAWTPEPRTPASRIAEGASSDSGPRA